MTVAFLSCHAMQGFKCTQKHARIGAHTHTRTHTHTHTRTHTHIGFVVQCPKTCFCNYVHACVHMTFQLCHIWQTHAHAHAHTHTFTAPCKHRRPRGWWLRPARRQSCLLEGCSLWRWWTCSSILGAPGRPCTGLSQKPWATYTL